MSSLLLLASSNSRDYYWLIIRSFLLFALLLTTGRAASDDSFNRVVQAGFNLQLPCTPPGSEEILNYFTWCKNDKDLNLDRTPSLFQSRFSIQNDFSLKIENITEEDEGTYTCNVWSEPARTTSYTVQVEVPATIELPMARLTVTGDRNVVISAEMETAQHHSDMNDDLNLIDDVDPSEVYQLREGGDLDLTCRVRGQPLPIVTWKFQGKVLNAVETISPADERPNRTIVSVHRITNARRVDAGRYVCEADNGVDMPAKAVFRVQVNYAPEIVVENNWVHAGLGSFTELVCIVHAQPPAHVTWFRSSVGSNYSSSSSTTSSSSGAVGNRQVPISSASSSSRLGALALNTGLKHVLRFKNVRDADLGVYTCQARNQLGEKESTLEMSGIAAPAVLRVAPPREGNMLLNFDDDHDIDGNKRRHYQLIWDVVSYSPIYEYKLWLRPRESIKNKQTTKQSQQMKPSNRDRAPHTNIIVPSSSAPAGTFMHSHGYVLTDLAIGVVYKVTVQSRNRFGWSVESNAVFLSGGGSDDDDGELDYHEDQQTNQTSSSSTSVRPTTTVQTTPQSTSPTITTTTTVTTSSVAAETTTIKTPEKEQQMEVKPEDKPTSEAQQPIPVTPGNSGQSMAFEWLLVVSYSVLLLVTSNTRLVEL